MQTIFITGTSGGLGKATVQLFHSKGWKVIATMRSIEKAKDFDGLENVIVLPLDITNPEQINTTVIKAISLAKIDVVLNNAAFGAIGPLESVTEENLQKQIDTNLLGAIRVTRAFIPHFRENKNGVFINITSIAGLVTFPFSSIYHTVKFAMEAFSEGLSYELAPFGISVKTIAPGFIRTDFGANMVISSAKPYKEAMDKYLKVVAGTMDPATSGSTPEQIAEVIFFALTDNKDQVHYTAGPDSKIMYQQRLEIGAEGSRKEMAKMFLG